MLMTYKYIIPHQAGKSNFKRFWFGFFTDVVLLDVRFTYVCTGSSVLASSWLAVCLLPLPVSHLVRFIVGV